MTWKMRTLGEICDEVEGIIRTGPFGSQLHESDYEDEGIPVVMPKDLAQGRVSIESIARVGADTAERLGQHRLQVGDIVYGRRGDIGRRALISEREAGWLCGTGCLRISVGASVVDPTFLYYYLGDTGVTGWIANQAIGATLPNLNTTILRSVPIRYPALVAQRRIAAILSAYDDLIENNTRRIAILEEMARLIYREWFVHFRFPGHERVAMVDSVLGPVPEPWTVVRASDALTINPKVAVPIDSTKPFVPMNALSEGSMLVRPTETRSGNNGAKFANDDTLFARITPCLENGKTAFVQFLPSDEGVAIGSTEFIVLRSKTLTPELVYLLARSETFRDNAIKSMSGASGRQRVQEQCFDRFLMPQPPQDILARFSHLAKPIFRQIHVLANVSEILRQTRDLLLPKLISGELVVSELDIDTRQELTA